MNIMRNLRRIRESRGLTQGELADLAGVTQNSISKIETGGRNPQNGTLKKMAEVLGVEDPQILADEFPTVLAFEEILAWPVERRQRYFEFKRELGELDSLEKQLAEHHQQTLENFGEDRLVLARLEAAYMYGYTRGYAEAKEESTDVDP
jgi:transcriptional regulator with XRE-family HTH domain